MTFAQTWLRQAIGAAGASLLAPLAIVAAAGILLAGGGLGGLSELGQVTSGPTLPGNELPAGRPAIADADIIGVDTVTAGGGAAGSATGGGTPGAPGIGGGGPVETGGPVQSPLLDVPFTPGGGGDVDSGPAVEPAPPQGGATPGGTPPEVVDTTRGIQMVVPEPIRPVTENLINLLVGPPQP